MSSLVILPDEGRRSASEGHGQCTGGAGAVHRRGRGSVPEGHGQCTGGRGAGQCGGGVGWHSSVSLPPPPGGCCGAGGGRQGHAFRGPFPGRSRGPGAGEAAAGGGLEAVHGTPPDRG